MRGPRKDLAITVLAITVLYNVIAIIWFPEKVHVPVFIGEKFISANLFIDFRFFRSFTYAYVSNVLADGGWIVDDDKLLTPSSKVFTSFSDK